MELYAKDGRRYRPVADELILATARAIALRGVCEGKALHSPREVKEFLAVQYAGLEHEVFGVLFLNSKHKVIAFEAMFRGTVDGASVHPREVVKAALRHNASAVILSHNHPSGSPEPSQADEAITRRLRDALALVEIRVLDHLILAPGDVSTSFAELGLL